MIVVDTTVLADWVFGDEGLRSQADGLLRTEPEWITVELYRYELGNVGWKSIRFGEGWDAEKVEAAMAKAEAILTEVVTDLDWNEVLQLAVNRELSYYDAAYAWLAVSRGLPMYSRDGKLVAKCAEFACSMPEG